MYSILLADDESIFLDYMQKIIPWSQYGCRVDGCAGDGKAACRYIEEHRPDIAFIDISMPLADGIEVCTAAKQANAPTRLIIMTAHDEFSFAYRAIKLGIDDYLLKPFSREELVAALKKAIGSIRGASEPSPGSAIEDMEEGSTKLEIMKQAIDDYLLSHYRDASLSMTLIEKDLGFDSSYLRKVYKMKTGITIMQKLEDIRINRAKQLLLSGRYQHQEITEMVGFSDPFYFSKRFKQICGVTPTEYAKKRSATEAHGTGNNNPV
ncbi:MAG: response regulator [Lachnospiraceae bacterium]|jgi:two-component system response regulator YesN|nr:response regulator [Lachnospiraceae bacterium]